jgi:cobalamin-dependent methionine synthase I
LELFKLDFPQVKTMANVSQLSEGLPKRQVLASYFVSLAISKGLDYIVTNVLDEDFYESIVTTMSIMGKDKNLQAYLKYCRNHKEPKL